MKATRRTVIWASVMVAWLVCVAGISKAEGTNRAGLIVVLDGNVRTACVAFAESEITSAELLRRAGLNVVTRSSSGMGEDICKIADVGCDNPEDCFCACPESPCTYWSHWYWDAGEWRYSGMGDGGRMVGNGAIDAWVWGNQATQPHAVDYAQLCGPRTATAVVPTPSSTLAPWSPYPEDEQTEVPGMTIEPTGMLLPSETPWPTYTAWPTETPLPTATMPGSLHQVAVTPTLGDASVGAKSTTVVTPDVAATDAAAQAQLADDQVSGTPALDRVAAILSTQVAHTKATPQPVRSVSQTRRWYLALAPGVLVLVALTGYVILLRRQRARARSR